MLLCDVMLLGESGPPTFDSYTSVCMYEYNKTIWCYVWYIREKKIYCDAVLRAHQWEVVLKLGTSPILNLTNPDALRDMCNIYAYKICLIDYHLVNLTYEQ